MVYASSGDGLNNLKSDKMGYACIGCGSGYNLTIHHLTTRHRQHNITVCLCRKCHNFVHKNEDKFKGIVDRKEFKEKLIKELKTNGS